MNIVHPQDEKQSDAWKILIIDDDEDDYTLARDMLQEARGHRFVVEWAPTFGQGWKALQTGSYDAILVDYDLGSHSGIEIIYEATRIGLVSPLILFTGRGNYEMDLEAMQAGATLYLTKNEVNPLLLERSIRYAIERKQTELRLQSSEQSVKELASRFQAVLENSLDAVYRRDLRLDRYDYMSPVIEKILGFSPSEMSRMKIEETLSRIHPDDVKNVERALVESNQVGHARLVYRFQGKNGQYRWLADHATVTCDESGQPIYRTGAVRDITEQVRSEEALRNSEARFRDLANSISQLAWMADENGWIFWYNQRWFDYTGTTPEEMQGWGWQKVNHPDHIERVAEKLEHCFQTGESWEDTFPLRGNDGEYRWFLSRAIPIRDEGQQVVRWFGTSTDVTEQQLLQEENRKQRDLFERLVQVAPVGIAFLRGRRHEYILVNQAYRQVARGKGQLEGRCVAEVWPEIAAVVVPQLNRVYQSGESFSQNDVPFVIVRDGVPEQNYFTYSFTPILTEEGVDGIMFLTVETTQMVLNRQAVMDSEERFRQLADAMPQLVWTALPDGYIDYFNRRFEEYSGITQNEDSSWNWQDSIHPDDLTAASEAWDVAIRTGEIYQFELRMQMVNGCYRWHLARCMPVRDLHGKITRWFGTSTDIEDQKQNEQQLLRSNQDLEQFAFVASHDLQEPLRKIILFGENLRLNADAGLSETSLDYLERMESAARRMRTMISGLLDLSRVSTRSSEFTRVNLSKVVGEVVSDLEARLEPIAGQVLVGPLPVIEADELQMRQLFQNLIGNAVKFHKPDLAPKVLVFSGDVVGQSSLMVEIRVVDNGIGFEQQYAERIFQPFQRLHGRSEYEGTGLGLAICQKIVERHKGLISVESRPEKGTTFVVRLPVSQSAVK